jgi:hypothetical protein
MVAEGGFEPPTKGLQLADNQQLRGLITSLCINALAFGDHSCDHSAWHS